MPLGRSRNQRKRSRFTLESLEPRVLLAANPIISEVVADNDNSLTDGDGNSPDWIEIYNAGDAAADLTGYYLTDNPAIPTKWPFPAASVLPGHFLVVFASGQSVDDYVDPAGNLHTNFQLSAAGEYLALVAPGPTVVSEFAPAFPEQREDVSYGISNELAHTTILASGASGKVLVPTSGPELPPDWTSPALDDTAWTEATTPVGFDTVLPAEDSGDELVNVADQGFASQSTTDGAAEAALATDNDPATFSKTDSADTTPMWELDLVDDHQIGGIVIRNVDTSMSRLRDITVTIRDAADTVDVYVSALLNPENTLGGGSIDVGPDELSLDLVELTGGRVSGGIVRITRTVDGDLSGTGGVGDDDDRNALALAEVEVHAIPSQVPLTNAALLGAATQSTTQGGFGASLAIDGNLDNFTHTAGTDTASTWTLNLGGDLQIDNVVIHNRTSCCQSRLRDITVKIRDAADTTDLFVSDLLNPENAGFAFPGGPGGFTLDLVALTGGRVSGGIVQISRTSDSDLSGTGGQGNDDEANVLSLGEVEVNVTDVELPVNLAPTGTATQSSTLAGYPPNLAINENLGDFTHTNNNENPDPSWWQVDLGANAELDRIVIHNRDSCCQLRLRDITVSIRDADNTEVFVSDVLNPGNVLGGPETLELDLVALTGDRVTGGIVRIERTPTGAGTAHDIHVLSLGEVQVFGIGTVPVETNVALGKPTTQSTVAYNAPGSVAVDGNLGNYTHTASSDGAPTWEVDLTGPVSIDRVVVHNRDDCCQSRLRDITVDILGFDHATVLWSSGLLNPENTTFTFPAGPELFDLDLLTLVGEPVIGSYVRVTRTPDPDLSGGGDGTNPDEAAVLSLGEVQVFGDALPLYSAVINTDLADVMHEQNASAFLRMPFDVADPASLDALTLRMRYDDGFIAYLNDTPIASRNAPASPAFDSEATATHADTDALQFEEINVSEHLGLLAPTGNVLAVQGLNRTVLGNDFLLDAELVGTEILASDTQYLEEPSPGRLNGEGFVGFVDDTTFSVDRGFFDAAFDVAIHSATPGATIVYTTDGSTPSLTNGTQVPASDGATPPVAIVSIAGTTTLRARAFKDTYRATNTDTQTYVFLDDVLLQSTAGATSAGWPAAPVNGQVFDYGVDPEIVDDFTDQQMKDAFTSIATISLVTDLENLVDPGIGIYVNAQGRGMEWERPVSMEVIYPEGFEGETPDFQLDAGLRIRGGASRGSSFFKHSFRLFFRQEYGEEKLRQSMFGDDGADRFDNLDLRTSQNYSWARHSDLATGGQNTFVREVFTRDLQRDTDQPYPRSRYYHLYLNGQYWGVYQTQERAEASYGETYFGGDKEDFDVVKSSNHIGGFTTEFTDGTSDAWFDFWTQGRELAAETDPTALMERWYRIQGLNVDGTRNAAYPVQLDAGNLIDYMLGIFYTGDGDAPLSNFLSSNRSNNWFGMRDRTGEQGWTFYRQDGEHTLGTSSSQNDRTGPFTGSNQNNFTYSNPQWIHQDLAASPEYRLLFADHVQRHFFNGGAMTDQASLDRFNARADELGTAMIGQSARWGDARATSPFTIDHWQAEINDVLTNWIPGRTDVVLAQLRADGLYPDFDAPGFGQFGGEVAPGFALAMSDPADPPVGEHVLYFTTNGTDPRLPGGAVNAADATDYTAAVPINQTTTVKARILNTSTGEWSALTEALFTVEVPLRVSEVMYNPPAPTVDEINAGYTDNDDFEFVELVNTSATDTIDLEGIAFSDGITFTFGPGTLAPGERVLVVRDAAAFAERYDTTGMQIAGEYRAPDGSNKLSNNGETLALVDAGGAPIQSFRFNDGNSWPQPADGDGSSLETIDVEGDLDEGASWYASPQWGGSPAALASAAVIERFLFYDGSAFDTVDDDAIATDKQALLLGQTATAANVSSYAEGINGLILDVARPVDAHQIDETDFIFLTGNVDDLGAWTPLADPPTVTIRPGEGRGTSDRVVLTWAAGEAATNTWLQVTMNAASPETGLYADDVFHFGSAVGETFNSPTNLLTTSADVIAIRDNPRGAGNRADVLNPHDINRDWLVNAADQLLARNHATGPFNALRLVTPTLPPVAPPEAEGAAVTPSVPLLSASRASDGPGDVATPGATGWLLTPGGTGCLSASECDAVVHDFANTGGQAARATLTSPTPLDLVARARALRPTSRDRDDHAPTDAALNDELTVDLLRPLSIAASHHSG